MTKTLFLCDCLGTSPLDADALSTVDGVRCSKIHTHLCGAEIDDAARAITAGEVVISCPQEQVFFTDLAVDLDAPTPEFVDLRNRAGWSDQAADAGPKMAALLADALRRPPVTKTFDLVSEGLCLILGPTELALSAAHQLSDHLSVTVLLSPGEDVPESAPFDVIAGRLKSAQGALGGFTVKIDALQQVSPGGRGARSFDAPRDGARTECDIVLDLRGGTPLFPAPEKREGYLRADPGSLPATQAAILEASHLIGTFEKPLYLALDTALCAHSRAAQIGCSKCLDICPTSAIHPDGDHIDIDPNICAGCGSCAALCPSGAITADDPPTDYLFSRISGLAHSFRAAGGTAPRLLVHDRSFGAELIALAARHGRGLPADSIPLDLDRISGFGHAEMLAALACGFVGVDVLVAPSTERGALDPELALAQALCGTPEALKLLAPDTPDALCDLLYETAPGLAPCAAILPLGSRRQVTRLAVKALQSGPLKEPLPLPVAAPYGAVLVDTDACTLCLSCASLCPSGALGDNPDKPQLRFQEDACLQCGLCVQACPENALSLVPQFDTSDAAFTQQVLHEEEPFPCVECGTPFGVKSTIERIVEKLEGKHAMFATSDAARLIRMCDDCRVNAQFHQDNNPFAGADRPQVRTSEDYFSKRRDH